MAIAVRDSRTFSEDGADNSFDNSANKISITAGDLITVEVKWEAVGGSTISSVTDDIGGNTYTLGTVKDGTGTGGAPHSQIAYCLSSAGTSAAATITVTLSSASVTFKRAVARSVSGFAVAALDTAFTGGANTNQQPVTGTASTVDAVEYVTSLASYATNVTFDTPTIGGTAATGSNTLGDIDSFYLITSSAISSGTCTVHSNVSSNWSIIGTAFKETAQRPLLVGKFSGKFKGKF